MCQLSLSLRKQPQAASGAAHLGVTGVLTAVSHRRRPADVGKAVQPAAAGCAPDGALLRRAPRVSGTVRLDAN